MRIISTPLQQRYKGIVLATVEVNDQVITWNPNIKPVFDLFDEVKPELVYCDIKYVTKSFIEACNEYKDVKIVLFSDGVPRGFNPDVVCANASLSTVMKKHLELGDHKTIYVSDYADVVSFFKGDADEKLRCDISYYSYDIHQSPIEKLELFATLAQIAKLKIVGPKRLPLPQYIGNIQTNRIVSFLRSSEITIDWHGDTLLNYAACGVFTLSTVKNKLFPTIENSFNIDKQIQSFLQNKKARSKIAKKAQKEILSSDTSFHRLLDINTALGIEEYNVLIHERIEENLECALA